MDSSRGVIHNPVLPNNLPKIRWVVDKKIVQASFSFEIRSHQSESIVDWKIITFVQILQRWQRLLADALHYAWVRWTSNAMIEHFIVDTIDKE